MHSLLKSSSFHDSWKDTWKKYDEVELSHSSTHYLLAIHTLLKDNGYARVIDVSRYLGITPGSTSITLQKLKDKKYVAEDENKFLKLTDAGKHYVGAIISKRRMLILFFTEVLGLPEEIAEEDACKMEHLLSQEAGEKLITFINYALSESAEAEKFRDRYKEFEYVCHSTGECGICENDCYFRSSDLLSED